MSVRTFVERYWSNWLILPLFGLLMALFLVFNQFHYRWSLDYWRDLCDREGGLRQFKVIEPGGVSIASLSWADNCDARISFCQLALQYPWFTFVEARILTAEFEANALFAQGGPEPDRWGSRWYDDPVYALYRIRRAPADRVCEDHETLLRFPYENADGKIGQLGCAVKITEHEATYEIFQVPHGNAVLNRFFPQVMRSSRQIRLRSEQEVFVASVFTYHCCDLISLWLSQATYGAGYSKRCPDHSPRSSASLQSFLNYHRNSIGRHEDEWPAKNPY